MAEYLDKEGVELLWEKIKKKGVSWGEIKKPVRWIKIQLWHNSFYDDDYSEFQVPLNYYKNSHKDANGVDVQEEFYNSLPIYNVNMDMGKGENPWVEAPYLYNAVSPRDNEFTVDNCITLSSNGTLKIVHRDSVNTSDVILSYGKIYDNGKVVDEVDDVWNWVYSAINNVTYSQGKMTITITKP